MGLAAGIISICGALFALPNYFKPAPGKDDLVAVIVGLSLRAIARTLETHATTVRRALATV